MAKLTEAIKLFIVQRLACYDSPQEIADAVNEEFGVVIPRQQVEEYDPEKRSPGKKWRELHRVTREAFEQEKAREPAAMRAFRIRRLARMAKRAEDRKNYVLAASLYEQIAKEVGEAYTNRRVLTAGDPLKELAGLLGYTPEQLSAAIALDGAGAGDGEMSVTA